MSAVANPEIVKEYPEVLLTGVRQVEYINAQMHDVTAMRVRIPEAEAEVNPVTAAKYGIVHGELIGIETPRGSIKMKANVTQDIKPGVASVPHGWAEANCNIPFRRTVKGPGFRLYNNEQQRLSSSKSCAFKKCLFKEFEVLCPD